MSWLFWLSSNLYGLLRNYLAARKTGLPLFLLPINIYNPIWMVSLVPLNPLFKRIFPSWLYESVDIGTYGFEVRLKSSLFEKTGPAFILVTSGPMEMSIIDPELIFEILKRPKDFPNTEISAVIMDIFGSSVLTTNGETWSRQRKLIAPNINEKISSLVFGESCRQAREMLSFYMDDVKGVTNDTMRGMKKVAINVLGTAGFGISRPWNDSEEATRSKGHRLTYMEATKIVVENIVTAAVLPAKLIVLPFFPKDMQDLGHAKNDFPILSSAMLANERKLQETTAEPRHNLMSMLVRFAESNDEKSAGTQYLSEEEIQGNLFIFTAAGFDTTANTMAYALAFLATFPKWQDWIYEEISQVVGDREVEYLEYADIFPRLPRCLALMANLNPASPFSGPNLTVITVRNNAPLPTASAHRQNDRQKSRRNHHHLDEVLPYSAWHKHLHQHGRPPPRQVDMGQRRRDIPSLEMDYRRNNYTRLADIHNRQLKDHAQGHVRAVVNGTAIMPGHEDESSRVRERLYDHLQQISVRSCETRHKRDGRAGSGTVRGGHGGQRTSVDAADEQEPGSQDQMDQAMTLPDTGYHHTSRPESKKTL
ncbi:cytochrome P450 [Exophiala viscosa]|uniref:Cytochrome P450 n=1 Tax=Exophiala viscosa TaxID=2486360 RepID=A0AAN6DW22_9EURO|nr:cytochrome P450 [Exophiala viscosa]